MTNLDPPITDAERAGADRRFALYGLDEDAFGGFTWRALIATLVQAMREPVWVPEVVEKPAEHPDWQTEEAKKFIALRPGRGSLNLVAAALMTPSPKPSVDDATLCWRALMAERWPGKAQAYLSGERDAQKHKSSFYDDISHTLNWAKNREKRDDISAA